MNPVYRSAEIALRLALIGVCGCASWYSFQAARADLLFKQDSESSVRRAILVAPDGWEYYTRLAQFDRDHARDLLEHSLRLNPYNAQADIDLGLQFEANAELGRAQERLAQAFKIDNTYLPRWSLANFYLRRDDMVQFWFWARKSAEMPSDDVRGLFELCWRVAPDPDTISKQILNDNPELLRQYVPWLLSKNQVDAAAEVSARLLNAGDAESDRRLLFAVTNRLAAANRANAGTSLWHAIVQKGWAVADWSVPNNAAFAREPLPVAFDWSLPEYSGLHSWPGASGLETEFTGSQPEQCVVAEQYIWLNPGQYTLSSTYRTAGIAPQTGLHWQIIDAQSNSTLAESGDLSSEQGQNSILDFSIPPGTSLLRLRLAYHRVIGTTRISGTLVVASTKIKAKSDT